MHAIPAHPAQNPSLLPVMSYASADGHEWEVLEGDDGRLVVKVDGLLPYSFTDATADPESPARSPLQILGEGDPN